MYYFIQFYISFLILCDTDLRNITCFQNELKFVYFIPIPYIIMTSNIKYIFAHTSVHTFNIFLRVSIGQKNELNLIAD